MIVFQTPSPDALKAVLRRVFEGREYDWEVPRDPSAYLMQLLGRVRGWLLELHDAHPAAYVILLTTLTALLVVILAHLGYLAWRALRSEPVRAAAASTEPERQGARWHLLEARRLAELGRYREAIAQRFVALLLQLEARSVLTFGPSKTPAEYLHEVRLAEPERDAFAWLVSRLYGHLFGGDPCDVASLNTFDRDAKALESARASG